MKDGIHLVRAAKGQFLTQTWKNGRELHRSTETYKRRTGALDGALATAREFIEAGIFDDSAGTFNRTFVALKYWDHTRPGILPRIYTPGAKGQ